jgi:hypothetical protein
MIRNFIKEDFFFSLGFLSLLCEVISINHDERVCALIGLDSMNSANRARSFGQSLGADSSLESGRNQLLLGIGLPCLILELIPHTSMSFRWCG